MAGNSSDERGRCQKVAGLCGKGNEPAAEEDRILVSVVIPVYNGEKTITAALDSVLIQDVPLEIIVIDDCSKDHTGDLVMHYVSSGSLIYERNETNLGAAGSRNRGVAMARGKYVAFLDADDYWAPGKLKKQLEVMEQENCVLCSTARELMDPDGKLTGRVIGVKQRITYKELLKHNCINCSSVLLCTEAAAEFPMEHEDSHEDYITWLRILKKYGTAYGINEPLLKYRLSDKGKSGNKLKSARMTYTAYRYSGLGRFRSLLCFCSYALHGIVKYLRA